MNRKTHPQPFEDRTVERMTFDVSARKPVTVIHHVLRRRAASWFDMHYSLELGVVLRGEMLRRYPGGSLRVRPGEVWLCNMWEPHGFEIPRSPLEIVVLMIHPPMLAATHFEESPTFRPLSLFSLPPGKRPRVPPRLRGSVARLARQILQPPGSSADGAAARRRLKLLEILLLLSDQARPNAASPAGTVGGYGRIDQAIEKVFSRRRLVSVQEAAAACGLNRNAFGRLFRDVMGVSYPRFGLKFRLSGVAGALRDTDRPIKSISEEWGFSDMSHLHHRFVEHYGCTPAAYRRRAHHSWGSPK